jgi:hypothetical protein
LEGVVVNVTNKTAALFKNVIIKGVDNFDKLYENINKASNEIKEISEVCKEHTFWKKSAEERERFKKSFYLKLRSIAESKRDFVCSIFMHTLERLNAAKEQQTLFFSTVLLMPHIEMALNEIEVGK